MLTALILKLYGPGANGVPDMVCGFVELPLLAIVAQEGRLSAVTTLDSLVWGTAL